jgi:hypothetical protein
MEKGLRAAEPTATVRVESDRFVIVWEKGDAHGEAHLERMYREYASLSQNERANYITARTKNVMTPSLPATYAEAEPKLVPLLRERIDWEIARIMAVPDPLVSLPPEAPHVNVTDDLWGMLGYETEDQFLRVDGTALTKWNVSFDDAWRAAISRFAAKAVTPMATATSGLREVRYGDGNDSARLLVPQRLPLAGLNGDPVFAAPRKDLVLLVGADDLAGLEALTTHLNEEWKHGAESLRLVRIHDGKTSAFDVPVTHPLHVRLAFLKAAAEQRDEELQREQLRARLGNGDDAPFVATPKRIRHTKTGAEVTFVVHTEQTPTVLTRADYVVFRRVDLVGKTVTTLACGPWDTVFRMMKGRWKETPLRPSRWLANEIPAPAELKRLGCPNDALALDLNIARPIE